MRWFCVAPSLPAKASLRIRTAPQSDAAVCGRVSKGKIIGALSDVFEIATESGEIDPEDGTKWLHVNFPEEISGEWIEGFVMANLPDGMTLLVPWEDGDFLCCCTVVNERATLYDGPSETAGAVGTVDAGEGTRFPYGIREVVGTRSRILHDVHERVWVDAADIQIVCERLSHPNCRAPHSFYALNEELPQEAQIAIRVFPSRDAETLALLSRGQVIEVATRCESWLRLAGPNDVWIMWQTDTWQLLTELPFHSSDSCEALDGNEDLHPYIGSDTLASNGLPSEGSVDHDMEVVEDRATIALNSDRVDMTEEHGKHSQSTQAPIPIQSDEATATAEASLPNCQGERSCDESLLLVTDDTPESLPSTWDDRPINPRHDTDVEALSIGQVDIDMNVAYITTDYHDADKEIASGHTNTRPVRESINEATAVPVADLHLFESRDDQPIAPMKTAVPEAESSWDDRPIAPTKTGVPEAESSWDDRPIAPMKTGVPEAEPSWDDRPIAPTKTGVPEAEPSWDDRPIAPTKTGVPEAEPSWDDRPIAPMKTTVAEAEPSWDDRPIAPTKTGVPEAEPSWDDRPIAPTKTGVPEAELSWDDRPIAPMKTAVPEAEPSWDDRPIAPTKTGVPEAELSWDDRPIAPTKTGVPEAEPSWDDRPIAPMKTTVAEAEPSWDDRPIAPTKTGVPEAELSWDDRPIAPTMTTVAAAEPSWDDRPIAPMKTGVPEAETSWDDRPIAPMKAAVPETESSWDDRPITSLKQRTDDIEHASDARDNALHQTPAHEKDHGELSRMDRSGETSPNSMKADEAAEDKSVSCDDQGQLWHWEEAPIKSRHAINKTRELNTDHKNPESEGKPESKPEENPWARPVEKIPHSRGDTSDTTEIPRSPPGGVAADVSSVVWHSSDTGEDPWLFDDSDDLASDSGMFPPDSKAGYEENHERVSLPLRMPFSRRVYENREEEKVRERMEDVVAKELQTTYEAMSAGAVNEGPVVGSDPTSNGRILADGMPEKVEHKNGVNYQLEERLQKISSQHRGYQIFRAIALSEGPDAILEALAKCEGCDEDMLAYTTPASEQHSRVPSPSGSDSVLLDVLYSRDHTDPYSTPKKKPQTTAQVPAILNSVESSKERLAGILRRTPQKAKSSHSVVITSSNPEEILQAEFGSCSDELGLFGEYHYPAVSTSTRFMNGHAWTPSRGMLDGGSVLQCPSFTASSFSSPVPKENPLKRSAAAIAKTPPVVTRSLSASTAVTPTAPETTYRHTLASSLTIDTTRLASTNSVEQASVSASVSTRQQSVTTAGPALARAKTVGPQARTASSSSLPRSSLAAPSQLRRPTTSSLAAPVPVGNRSRSFTEEGKSIPPSASSASSSSMARQSLLQRKSMLPAPSPTRFGISRTNSATSTLGKTSLPSQAVDKPLSAATTATTTLLTRRTSFGFARPSAAKK